MGNNFTEGKKNSWHIWKGVWGESCQRQDFAQKKETSHLESSLGRFCATVTQEGKPVRCGSFSRKEPQLLGGNLTWLAKGLDQTQH